MKRDTKNAVLAGVCAGLANWLGLDPLIVRIAFIVFGLMGGASLLLYLILFVLMPKE